jgi:DNA polymerase-3 subunit beta
MDLFIDRLELARALASIQGIVERRPTQLALSHVLLHASSAGLRLTATDTEVAFIGDLQANVSTPGDLAVDASNLFQVIRTLDDPTVHLKRSEGDRLEVRGGRAVFRLPGIVAEDYPALMAFEARGQASMSSQDLRRLIDQVSFAIASDDQRYSLHGAHVELAGPNRVRFVATDGHRLSIAEAPYEGTIGLPPRMLLPRKALTALRKLLDANNDVVELSFGENAVQVARPEQRLWFRLLDGEFPDYKAVIPQSSKHVALCDREALNTALRRMSVLAHDRSKPVRFSFEDGELVMDVRSTDRGEVTDRVVADLEGDPIQVGFNVRYIQEILGTISAEQVRIELSEALGPARILGRGDENAYFVVMPMRLS